MTRKTASVLVVVAAGLAAGGYYALRPKPSPPQVQTSPISRGDVVESVGATGTLEAVTTVQVGTQVSGIIKALNVDFNSIVHKGQVIAQLDRSLFETQIAQAQANLSRSQADVERFRVELDDARSKLARAEGLAQSQLLPASELEAAQVAVRAAQAQLRSSEAQVTQARASLNQNQVNLDHTIITAPIDGIVIQRAVDVGQTVASSMQAPTLFILAADLTKMKVNANIDEADVGRIRPDQVVRFKVDAFPTDEFVGRVSQIRLQPVVVQNVVTYATVIDVPNPDYKLKPGMTATVTIEIAKRENALRVPNAALRFRPTEDTFVALNLPVPPEMQPRGAGDRASAGTGASGAVLAAEQPAGSGDANASGTQAQGGQGQGQRTGGRRGGSGGGDRGQGGQGNAQMSPEERRKRLQERLAQMSPEERTQTVERMKARGFDVTGLVPADGANAATGAAKGGNATRDANGVPKAATIDALFGPLPVEESNGRVWVYKNNNLQPHRLRLGITDGTMTEVLSGEVESGDPAVTTVVVQQAASSSVGQSPLATGGRRGGGPPGVRNSGGGGGGQPPRGR